MIYQPTYGPYIIYPNISHCSKQVTVDSLESMLQRYPGTLILVSHDRSLLDGVCSSFLVMQAPL